MPQQHNDQQTLDNLSRYDEMQLLDNIEDIDYLKSLLFDDVTLEKRSLTQEHLKLFKKLSALKQNGQDVHQDEIWSEAIQIEKTLWYAGAVINDMLYNLYELLAANPKLGYEINVDSDDNFGDDEDED